MKRVISAFSQIGYWRRDTFIEEIWGNNADNYRNIKKKCSEFAMKMDKSILTVKRSILIAVRTRQPSKNAGRVGWR